MHAIRGSISSTEDDVQSNALSNPPCGFNVTLEMWHHKLGHPSPPLVKHVMQTCKHATSLENEYSVQSISNDVSTSVNAFKFYKDYELSKSHKLPFLALQIKAKSTFALLYLDLWTAPRDVCTDER